jgi:hypothetical protein
MSEDGGVLDAEYRAFVRQLHQQTIEIVVEVDRWWMLVLFREVSDFTAGVFDREPNEEATKTRSRQLQDELQSNVEAKLNILAFGHPDPDVRRAANVLSRRLFGAVFYYDTIRAKRKDGAEATTAIQLVHAGLTDLRRAAYHAPFRESRPTPDYDGVGVVEPLPSQLTDIPTQEY